VELYLQAAVSTLRCSRHLLPYLPVRPFISPLPNYLPTYLPACQPARLTVCLSIRSSVYPSVRPSIHRSIHPSIHLHSSIQPSINPSVRPSIYPSIHPSVHPPSHPSIHPSVHVVQPISTALVLPLSRFPHLYFNRCGRLAASPVATHTHTQCNSRTHDRHVSATEYIKCISDRVGIVIGVPVPQLIKCWWHPHKECSETLQKADRCGQTGDRCLSVYLWQDDVCILWCRKDISQETDIPMVRTAMWFSLRQYGGEGWGCTRMYEHKTYALIKYCTNWKGKKSEVNTGKRPWRPRIRGTPLLFL
jgi:hypothetical protein